MAPSLDSKENNRNRPCGNLAVYGPVEVGGVIRNGIIRLPCNKWDCPVCGPRRQRELVKAIVEAAKEHGLSRLMTLTLNPKKIKGKNKYAYLRQVWAKFRVYLSREYGESVAFIAMMECHKSGIPHLHVLVDRYIRQAWISKAWERVGGGSIVDIRKVADLDKVGWYLAKHIAKNAFLGLPKGVRRYSTSRGIKLRQKEKSGKFKLLRPTFDQMIQADNPPEDLVILDRDGNPRMFFEVPPIDNKSEMDPTGGFVAAQAYGAQLFPEFAALGFDEFYCEVTEDEIHDIVRCVCSGLQQGAAFGGLLHPGATKVAGRSRPVAGILGRAGVRGCGIGQAGWPFGVRGDGGILAILAGVPNDPR